ncbi:hypothetical protein P4S95_16120 [Aneurinibacillus aneurinilyticus]|uniref:hypothetical protein n=1 Tax=Aneurinibacillus aneurinilyticus TaxID=1391 RepID=UPI002E228820|nr:hypothetical protein [Aneurinibacillus aneurinilyticus]
MMIHKVKERRCTRRRVPSSFSHREETWPLCGVKAGPAKHLGIGMRNNCWLVSFLAPYTVHNKGC